jgi:hypothetical protein
MKSFNGGLTAALVLGTMSLSATALEAQAQQPELRPDLMSFFITSDGPGDGGNLGGIEGADAHCQRLATAVGAGARTWRAYLSTSAAAGQPVGNPPPVHARERIGEGPWYNARGQLIASSVADLHGDIHRDRNMINKNFAVNERGEIVPGSGDQPNQHDILTGSDSHGRALPIAAAVATCSNWTSNSEGSAMVGHHDRIGGGNTSWNAVHLSRGCSQPDLVATGGAGYFYCFAI